MLQQHKVDAAIAVGQAYTDDANNAQDAALAAGIETENVTLGDTDTYVFTDIDAGSAIVSTDDAETYIDEYGVTVYQYNGKGDVSVDDESLLNNAADIDVLQDSAVSIDENGQVSTKGHSNTYEVNGYTYTDNGYGSYTTDDPAQADKFFSEGYLADTLGGTLTNPEPDLVTEGELATALEGIETGNVDLSEIEDAISSNDVDIRLTQVLSMVTFKILIN